MMIFGLAFRSVAVAADAGLAGIGGVGRSSCGYAHRMARFVGRANVRKRLAGLEGEPGRTVYADGAARIEHPEGVTIVRPPFGLGHEGEYDMVRLTPLFDALAEDYIVAVLLVRLGGYAVGVFDGERLVASKVGSRFVKNRHKKGGSSANRFRRRRQEQARVLIDEAASTAIDVLEPWRDRVEFVAFGGHRPAITEVLDTSPQLGWLNERAVSRFFTVTDPRQYVLERMPYDLYAAEVLASDV
jgi:predicted RNA methylase